MGLFLSFYIPENVWDLVQSECPELEMIEKFGEDFEPHLNLINKPLAAKKPVSSYLSMSVLCTSFTCDLELDRRVNIISSHLSSFGNMNMVYVL